MKQSIVCIVPGNLELHGEGDTESGESLSVDEVIAIAKAEHPDIEWRHVVVFFERVE